jgi:hypothetical protein
VRHAECSGADRGANLHRAPHEVSRVACIGTKLVEFQQISLDKFEFIATECVLDM